MKTFHISIALLLVSALFLQSCASLTKGQFAVAVKRNQTNTALRTIGPQSGQLRVTERNGKVYYPIEYAMINDNRTLTYALLENGSPTQVHGRSLAYNAAVVGNRTLGSDLASNGYGSHGDVSRGWNQYQAYLAARKRREQATLAVGIMVLAALMSSGGGGGSSESGNYMGHHEEGTYLWAAQHGL